jgi:hypothetical protein
LIDINGWSISMDELIKADGMDEPLLCAALTSGIRSYARLRNAAIPPHGTWQ